MYKNGAIADPGGNRFPFSRDFGLESLNVTCGKITCAANYNKKCTMPSLIEMNSKGVCKGCKPRKTTR